MKYRKRPLEVEAWQWVWTPKNNSVNPVLPWVQAAMNRWPDKGSICFEPNHKDGPRIGLAAVNGFSVMCSNDWLVKGVDGELYSVTNEVFWKTHEAVKE